MFAVMKRDFLGQWIQVYRAMQFQDAERFRKGMNETDTKIIQI